MQATQSQQLTAKRIIINGRVQGVGFRPFIYHHATQHHLSGWVRNISGRVEVNVQGDADDIDRFMHSLVDSAPPISAPVIVSIEPAAALATDSFTIEQSHSDDDADIHLPADLYTCPRCRDELDDPDNSRYRYPFINCTQCGPRYTIVDSLPYDRSNTSMAAFELCDACNREYQDVSDRRYHAEPVACERCGPVLTYRDAQTHITGNEASLQAAVDSLLAGKVVAIKGIGGYHLACDARDDQAIDWLRQHKPRPHKPLAVMFSEDMLWRYIDADETEKALLLSPTRPIVLVRELKLQNATNSLSRLISPGMDSIGVMLPYSPLHHLLLQECTIPLVMTSANISGEPVLTDNDEVERRLAHVAQAYLHHDRDIVRPVDDSVYRVIDDVPRPIRIARGVAPLELNLPFQLDKPVLATGCHMKNTIALAWDDRVVISPHIGEMDNKRSLDVFQRTIDDLQSIYQVTAEQLVCDAHPAYGSSRWAKGQGLPVHQVYHHHAHAAAAWFEAQHRGLKSDHMLVFTWDGVGLGPDGSLWGGDALLGAASAWRRVAHFRPFRLPGGERAGREPWRSAAGLCWEAGLPCPIPQTDEPLLKRFWQQQKNTPSTTAVGRLFDAAAALTGVCIEASFEGQAPMWLESMADQDVAAVDLPLQMIDDRYSVDWSPLISMLCDESATVGQRAGSFHRSMATTLLQQALTIRKQHAVDVVALAGGVFQNRILTEQASSLLRENGFEVIIPELIPVNDAGISFGQIIEYGCQTTNQHGEVQIDGYQS